MEDRERKILEWCGWKLDINYNDPVETKEHPPNIDPNFIAGYVLPALREQGYIVNIEIDCSASVSIEKSEWHGDSIVVKEQYHAINPDPLEAFLQALEKLIDG